MAGAFAKEELTGVDRIIPGVLRAFLSPLLQRTPERDTEHPERQEP